MQAANWECKVGYDVCILQVIQAAKRRNEFRNGYNNSEVETFPWNVRATSITRPAQGPET